VKELAEFICLDVTRDKFTITNNHTKWKVNENCR